MRNSELLDVGRRAIDSVLGASNDSYKNTFQLNWNTDGASLLFVPIVPAPFIINEDLIKSLYHALSFAFYPFKTVLQPKGVNVQKNISSTSFSTARGISFPVIDGIPKRLILPTYPARAINDFMVPIMSNYVIDFNKETNIGISGASGTGKSTFANYLITQLFKAGAELTVIDPKCDDLTIISKSLGISCLHLNSSQVENDNDFVDKVNNILKDKIQLIKERQKSFLKTSVRPKQKLYIVIDEVIALMSFANKNQADTLKNQLETIAVLGRSAGVHLLLMAQDWNASTSGISTTLRGQISVRVALGQPSKSTLQYLFPDSDGVIVPNEIGVGVIGSNSVMSGQPFPLLTPTVSSIQYRGS